MELINPAIELSDILKQETLRQSLKGVMGQMRDGILLTSSADGKINLPKLKTYLKRMSFFSDLVPQCLFVPKAEIKEGDDAEQIEQRRRLQFEEWNDQFLDVYLDSLFGAFPEGEEKNEEQPSEKEIVLSTEEETDDSDLATRIIFRNLRQKIKDNWDLFASAGDKLLTLYETPSSTVNDVINFHRTLNLPSPLIESSRTASHLAKMKNLAAESVGVGDASPTSEDAQYTVLLKYKKS
jgi:hypothetical protein